MDLQKILSGKKIFPVFQPVVSLESGDIFGYEAFSRIEGKSDGDEKPVTELFYLADKAEKSWKLEKICRRAIIRAARMTGLGGKLFININPDIILDEEFRGGFTMKLLEKYGVNPDSIVLEITEHCAEGNPRLLGEVAAHYRAQNFSIALDNVGSAYSGLERICTLNPDFIKIDMNIIRGIETDGIRQSMVRNLAKFCDESGTAIVAVGVETARELDTLLNLGVHLAQGFFLGRPQRVPGKVTAAAYARIAAHRKNSESLRNRAEPENAGGKRENSTERKNAPAEKERTIRGGTHSIGELAAQGVTVFPDMPLTELMGFFHANPACPLVTVVDTEQHVLGIMPRMVLADILGGQFGFGLNSRKILRDMMLTEFLAVDWNETSGAVATKAMARGDKNLYDPVIVERGGKYSGIVTIKELLDCIVTVEVNERTREISRKNRLLQNQQQIQARDMKMAELVQKSFYPSAAPSGDGWECAFIFRPMASVSGDLYDFYRGGNGKFSGVGLFDVSGHGVASGLVGILSKYLAEKIFTSGTEKPLGDVMGEFSRTLSEAKGAVENYLTGIFLRIDGNHVEYANGGHTDVLLRSQDGKVSFLGGEDGSFRGMFLGMAGLDDKYGTVNARMKKGDTLLLYTDCLVESRNLAGDEMGAERLAKILSQADKTTAKGILEHVIEIFRLYTEAVPLRDDLTVIALRYTGE